MICGGILINAGIVSGSSSEYALFVLGYDIGGVENEKYLEIKNNVAKHHSDSYCYRPDASGLFVVSSPVSGAGVGYTECYSEDMVHK